MAGFLILFDREYCLWILEINLIKHLNWQMSQLYQQDNLKVAAQPLHQPRCQGELKSTELDLHRLPLLPE